MLLSFLTFLGTWQFSVFIVDIELGETSEICRVIQNEGYQLLFSWDDLSLKVVSVF